ncbi:MAG: NADPH-dependent FMN reductase, partial [Chitinophagaceae bacterium]
TRRVALHLQSVLSQTTEHEIGLIDMKEWDLPSMQTVFSSVDNTPAQWKPLSERIFAAEAFILVSPEYNGSYSPALKNLLDHYPKQHHKPFAIATASPGAMGGIRATQQMLLLVSALFGIASPYLLVVPGVDKKFDREGKLIDESFHHSVHNFTSEFLWLAEHLVKDKVVV